MAKHDMQAAFLKALKTRGATDAVAAPKEQIVLEMDADVLSFFKHGNMDATARIKRVLQEHVERERRLRSVG